MLKAGAFEFYISRKVFKWDSPYVDMRTSAETSGNHKKEQVKLTAHSDFSPFLGL